MKNTQKRCLGALGTLLSLASLLGSASPSMAQAGRPKPPVAPRDGKPAHYAAQPSKTSVATVTFRLRHDRRLDGSNIHVTSHGHRVGLYGSVPNYHQRRIARQIAQSMPGVTYVADHLQVISLPPPAADIVAQVRTSLHKNSVTSGAPITVRAHRDVVTLLGTVATLRVKQTAIRLAYATPRVSVVQDHLTVTPGATGDALAASVQTALQRDQGNPVRSLHVLEKGSYIYLRGVVFSQKAKRRAGDTAAGVPGVTGMSNTLTILPARLRGIRHG